VPKGIYGNVLPIDLSHAGADLATILIGENPGYHESEQGQANDQDQYGSAFSNIL
jgi:hypothetical protein